MIVQLPTVQRLISVRVGHILRETGGRAYTSREVAKVFGVSQETVYRWIKTGKLPSVRTPGGHYLVRQDELCRLLG